MCLLCIDAARAQAQRVPERLAPLNEWSVGAEFSNDSSHIILGQAFNRRLAGTDLTWSRRVGRTHVAAYTWEIEARPVVFLQDPLVTRTFTLVLDNGTTQSGTGTSRIQRRCTSDTSTEAITFTPPGSAPVSGTLNIGQVCSTLWTYAGGLSPVGQRINFAPAHALQPYLLANGGFLVSTRDVPVDDSSRFNFTFSFGTGLQWFRPDGSAWSFDYRVQHLSSKNIGDLNPGVDSQVFRVSYMMPRLRSLRSR